MALTTIVLAGGPADDVAAQQPGAPNKAFVEVGGRALVARTLDALRAANSVGRIIAVAPPSMHAHPALAAADERRADGVRIRDSLASGLRGLPPGELVLVSASDLPVLTAASVDDFVARAVATQCDLGYGCLERSTHVNRFPQIPHTWVRLRGGTYCGGAFVVLRPRVYPALERFIERLGAARKNPLRLASLFGWDILLRVALRRATVGEAEARASRILGARVRAVVSPYPETAVNVDRAGDIALAEQLIAAAPVTLRKQT